MRGQLNRSTFNTKALFWLVPYLGGLMLISYFGSYGGKNLIPFGWDFLIIGLFTIAILYLALRTRLSSTAEQLATTKLNEQFAVTEMM